MKLFDLGRYKMIAIGLAAFMLLVSALLAFNVATSNRTTSDLVGIKYMAAQQAVPTIMTSSTAALRAQLKARAPVAGSFADLRAAVTSFDQLLTGLATDGVIVDSQNRSYRFDSMAEEPAASTLNSAQKRWGAYKAKLETIYRLEGNPYQTDTSGVVTLNERGQRLDQALSEVEPLEDGAQKELGAAFKTIADQLEANARQRANLLGIAQVVAILLAVGGMIGILVFFGGTIRRDEQESASARKETNNILNTVNEGLFLLDRGLRIGTARSLALNDIFRRDDLSNMNFEDLMRGIVPEKTLKTAQDYVALLWGERVNEKLVKTINPLNEVEVHFDNSAGGFDTHFLEFDFNRVKSEGQLTHLLVTVNDVTKRVMLSRELQESQEKAQAQLDLLLRILHVDPGTLTGFLTDSETSLKMVNTILREPAREESMFRTKIDSIYRQIHAVKGEASALGLKTVEQRAHAFEESLNEIKGRNTISGNDFLPLVVKLDDLFNHLAQVREMLGRLVDLHQAIAGRRATEKHSKNGTEVDSEDVGEWLANSGGGDAREGTAALEALVSGAGLQRTLNKLAQKVADNSGKQVELDCIGLDNVPDAYRRPVKDIAIQLVRNSVVHGIEAPSDRGRMNKTEFGHLSLEFVNRGSQGMELIVKDDGRGLQLDRIKEVAIKRGVVTAAQASMMDQRQTMALIFRPGFSTAEDVTSDAGRGAGMDLVRSLVAELNGRVGMATAKGRYTKFKIWLPAPNQAAAA